MKQKAFIYVRKSTDNKNKQVLSLDAQRTEMYKLAKLHDFEIVEVFEELVSTLKQVTLCFRKCLR